MKEQIAQIKEKALCEIQNAKDAKALDDVRIKYLGKKGELTLILRGMGGLSPEERPVIGSLVNEVRDELEAKIEEGEKHFANLEIEKKLATENIDVTMPSKKNSLGSVHPITQIINDVKEIFIGMGYEIADGPEVELAEYNFDKLNTPPDHPARDIQDTFYITDDIVLRSQTSPVQARVMETKKPPIKIICPGAVYRSDSVADLKGTLDMFAKKCLGEKTLVRFRPHHFPFTEPSAEADVSCFVCGGKGCRVCKGEGWIELLGCGMVHPNVLRNCNIDPEEYSGFAFGFGVERIAMAKFGIDDMRLLYENDVRFLKQF